MMTRTILKTGTCVLIAVAFAVISHNIWKAFHIDDMASEQQTQSITNFSISEKPSQLVHKSYEQMIALHEIPASEVEEPEQNPPPPLPAPAPIASPNDPLPAKFHAVSEAGPSLD
jgi:hypothetical protein